MKYGQKNKISKKNNDDCEFIFLITMKNNNKEKIENKIVTILQSMMLIPNNSEGISTII